jgi:ParB family chromosome partitioning protein
MTKQTKITVDTATDLIDYISLADLYLSDLNPRQEVAQDGIELLAQSLIACGLIQNLAGLRDQSGKVAIVAGGRRLRALQIAAIERTDLGLVPVRMAPSEHVAQEWANAENTAREDLNPVDEVRAYGKMAAKSLSLAKISRAFGVTEAHVRRRLALSGLPEAVLDALRCGEISLGIAKAMTVSSDEAAILEVLGRAKGNQWINEHQIKRDLNPTAINGTNRIAQFVGEEAYTAAGGTVSQDLFENEVLFNNPDILEGLFAQKLDDAATALQEAEGWNWVMTSEESSLYWYEVQREHGFARVYKEEGVFSEDQLTRHVELTDLADSDALDDAGQAELDQMDAIAEGDYSPAQRQLAGVMVYVSHDGTMQTVEGLIKREDQEEAIIAGILEASAHEEAASTAKKDKPAFSQKFVDDMTAIRLAAVQTALLEKPEFVLDLLAFALAPASGYYSNVLGVRFDTHRNKPEAADEAFTLSSRIGGALTEAEELAQDDVETTASSDLGERFTEFRATGKKQRNAQITQSFARALQTQKPEFMAVIEQEAGADIRAIWTPTDTNCFKRLNGAQLDALYMDLLDLSTTDANYKNFTVQKKSGKVEGMHELFHDPEYQALCGVTPEQKARIETWVPECF